MNACRLTDRIVALAKALVGHFHGGLAQVTIVSGMIFAGISGSATAETAALGSVLIPAMKKEGYDPAFAAAVTVCWR
jgi:TRAP-type C4-dicarboxylate transport system permease large subunit